MHRVGVVVLLCSKFDRVPSQLCNRSNGNRFWVEITHCGGFTTSAQKKVDSQGKSSFVQNFDAYLETKGGCRAFSFVHSSSQALHRMFCFC